jgi:transcriptional regulator with XRE-family HTH domain
MEPKDLILSMKATGMTQADIAAESGIPQPTISKIERGAVKDVMLSSYRALQGAYERRCGNSAAASVAVAGEAGG